MIHRSVDGWTDVDPDEATDTELKPERMAFHEAGHAVACLCQGLQFKTVTLGQTDGIQGKVSDKIIAYHAGTIAEKLLDQRYYKSGCVDDLGSALFLARSITNNNEEVAVALCQEMKSIAERLVRENEHKIRNVASALLKKENRTMSYEEVKAACAI